MQISIAQNILIVDEEHDVNSSLCGYLDKQGFQTRCATSLVEMEHRLRDLRPDLIILDVCLPGGDGLALCRRLSEIGPPVIVTSALGDETDRILGLEMGARDYLAKPYNPRELLARIRAIMRRTHRATHAEATVFSFGGLTLDLHKRRLLDRSGRSSNLTPSEFSLLCLFAENPDRVLSRAELMQRASKTTSDNAIRAIDVQISRLRKRLRDESGRNLIVAQRGRGYMLDAEIVRH